MIENALNKIAEYIETVLEFFLEGLLYIFEVTFGLLMDAIITVLEAIPVPAFVGNLQGHINNYFSLDGVAWANEIFKFDYGFAIVLGSQLIVLILRRIPFIN